MDRPEDWTVDSNTALRIHLYEPEHERQDGIKRGRLNTTLAPKWTYTIFGEHEKIFGYKFLSIDLSVTVDSLLTLLEIKFGDQIPSSLGVDAEDLDSTISAYLSEDTYRDRSQWLAEGNLASANFVPFGDPVTSYHVDDIEYAIHRVSLADISARAWAERMQIFSVIYIEGGSLIDTSDDRFDVWTVYAVTNKQYAFIGYCTCYKYNFYDKVEHSFDRHRYRISQFVILPHAQGRGHGSRLYDAIVEHCATNKEIAELTVEDPSEAFDDLRDRRDYGRLKRTSVFADASCTLLVSKPWIESCRRDHKLVKRQFVRLTEMSLLASTKVDKIQDKNYRKMVKSRLYKKNRDILTELEPTERLEKLEETYQNQIADYERLLQSMKPVATNGKHKAAQDQMTTTAKRQKLNTRVAESIC